MNEHGWLKLAMENTKDTKAPLTLQIGVLPGWIVVIVLFSVGADLRVCPSNLREHLNLTIISPANL
jgi:hypothetical protein